MGNLTKKSCKISRFSFAAYLTYCNSMAFIISNANFKMLISIISETFHPSQQLKYIKIYVLCFDVNILSLHHYPTQNYKNNTVKLMYMFDKYQQFFFKFNFRKYNKKTLFFSTVFMYFYYFFMYDLVKRVSVRGQETNYIFWKCFLIY